MAQTQAPDSGLRIPLAVAVWTAPTTVYKYDAGSGFGTFAGTKDAALYAPESGLLLLMRDGTWLLKKDVIKDGKFLGTRQWVGVSEMTPADGLKNNTQVAAGQLLGISKEDFALSLAQTVNETAQTLDPVPFLIAAPAKFETRTPLARQAPPSAVAHAPIVAQPHAQQTPAELATTPPAELATKRTFKPGHLVAAGVGGLFIGGLVAYNMRRR